MLTVVLSVFNEKSNLESCVECILQNRHFDSIHIVDDCSEDSTRDQITRLASRNDRIIPHYNAINRGTVKSIWSVAQYLDKGYVLFASASDRILPSLTEQAYFDLIKDPTVGLWTAKSLYFKTQSLINDYLRDYSGAELFTSRFLTQDQASSRYIEIGRGFEGSCTFFSVPLLKYFGLDLRLGGFADLLLGIQCLCHSGQILNSGYQSIVQVNQPGCGYLESSYKKLKPYDVHNWIDESYTRFAETCPNNNVLHVRYAQCLKVAKALVSYGYSRRFPRSLMALLMSPSVQYELTRLYINRKLESYGRLS